MCGIAGIISTVGRDFEPQIVDMMGLVRHRGPDGEGRKDLLGERVWLGHRRLAIIDLSETGAQPMSFGDGRYWIIHNGEIYNYVELRTELEGRGYQFVSDSDTEVILAAYACWGRACLDRFNGMWGFLIVDCKEGKIFGARDRFGIKPLYYWKSPEGFLAVASEIKEFTILPGWRAKLDGQAAYDYLAWAHTDHGAETMFHGVKQLLGGEAFEIDLNGSLEVKPSRWYAPTPRPFAGTFEDAATEFRALFRDAVRLRLRADVEVGACLSGGLDSSSIVGTATEFLDRDAGAYRLKTFSAVFPGKAIDETRYIRDVQNHCDFDAYFVTPKLDDLLDGLKQILWHQEQPFQSTSVFAGWKVFGLAGGNVKVVLDGQGADESLAGYHIFLVAKLIQVLKSGRLITFSSALREVSKKRQVPLTRLVQFMLDSMLPGKVAQFARKLSGKNTASNMLFDVNALNVRPTNRHADLGLRSADIKTLSLSQITKVLPALLRFEDRNSMAHSIETRLPFLDYRMVEFALGLPDDYLIRDWETKKVLRAGLANELPTAIRERHSKIGFETPESEWFGSGKIHGLLSEAMARSEILDSNKAQKLHGEIISGRTQNYLPLWRIICFEHWMERYGVAV